MTSDKGLCGSINSGIVREVKRIIGHNASAYQIFCIGEKGVAALSRAFPD
jgi:F-type H+-transporting ATPase subunit gamma